MPTMDEIRKRIQEGKNIRAKSMADAAGLPLSTLYAAIERGEVEAIKVGYAQLIPAHEAARLLGLKPKSAAPIAA